MPFFFVFYEIHSTTATPTLGMTGAGIIPTERKHYPHCHTDRAKRVERISPPFFFFQKIVHKALTLKVFYDKIN